jgi:hypothetical protein
MSRLRQFGAAGGTLFAVFVVIAYAIDPGPSSPDGPSIVNYYSTHATQGRMSAVLVGIAAVFFIWFAEMLAWQLAAGSPGVVGAGATAALYLVAAGCWEVLGELYGGGNGHFYASEVYADARVLYDVGVGAVHFANFTAAAFVGATAVGMIHSTGTWRRLGWVGIGFALVRLVSALIVVVSHSHWSAVLETIVFLGFVVWVFVMSVVLVVRVRQASTDMTTPAT